MAGQCENHHFSMASIVLGTFSDSGYLVCYAVTQVELSAVQQRL